MTTAALTARASLRARSTTALSVATGLWFAALVLGEGLFLYYIVAFYGPATLTGHFEGWKRNTMLASGYVPGDTVGNLSFAAHVMLAAVVTFAGVIQLVPQVRARAPAVHRWLGRAFLTSAMAAALAGVYGVWVRGGSQDMANAVAITLNAGLILVFGAQAWRTALRRDFAVHRRWAMRAFLVVNGVFFLRLGVVAYGAVTQFAGHAPLSFERFFDLWVFGSYLAPLAVLELYLRAQAGGDRARFAMAVGLVPVAALTALGGIGAWFGVYAPILAKL